MFKGYLRPRILTHCNAVTSEIFTSWRACTGEEARKSADCRIEGTVRRGFIDTFWHGWIVIGQWFLNVCKAPREFLFVIQLLNFLNATNVKTSGIEISIGKIFEFRHGERVTPWVAEFSAAQRSWFASYITNFATSPGPSVWFTRYFPQFANNSILAVFVCTILLTNQGAAGVCLNLPRVLLVNIEAVGDIPANWSCK